MILIGFTGKKGSGKTTAASLLSGFKKVNFKDALIKEIKELFPELLNEIKYLYMSLGYDYDDDSLFTEKPPLIRRLMQNFGTDVRRKSDRDYWVNRWVDSVHDSRNDIVVDDVRFVNEGDAVFKEMGYLIRVIRPGDTDDTHISETEMDIIAPDYTIINEGTEDEFKEKVSKVIKQIYEENGRNYNDERPASKRKDDDS